MTTAQAQRAVLLAAATVGAWSAVRQMREGHVPAPSIVVGALTAAVALVLVAEVAPQVAAGLAAIMVVGVIFTGAPTPLQAVGRVRNIPRPVGAAVMNGG